jgi:hypothetical protein
MTAFNSVNGQVTCPNCGQVSDFDVQFKYGDTWQYIYRIGDKIRWGGNDIGTRGRKRVLVEGIAGPCFHCHNDNLDFDVLIVEDEIVAIVPVHGSRQGSGSEGFSVLEP